MATAKKSETVLMRLLRALRTSDAALIKRTSDEAEAEMLKVEDEEAEEERKQTADSISTLQKTVDALTVAVASLAKARTKDEKDPEDDKTKTGDEEDPEDEKEKTKTGDAMRALVPHAEILAPGFSTPTADSVANMAGVVSVQRRVLSEAIKTADGKTLITPLLAGRTIDSLPAEAVPTVFLAASAMTKQKNNASGARQGISTSDSARKIDTPAEVNKRNTEFWKNNRA